MSVGSFLSTKSQIDNYDRHKRIEYYEVEEMPEREREEIREIYRGKGFEGALLEQVVETITADKDRWVDTMMKDELGMTPEARSPVKAGAVTFTAFIIAGSIPLIVYVINYISGWPERLFGTAAILTGLAFAGIGFLKTFVTGSGRWKGVVETLLLGSAAALVAYGVGALLERIIIGATG